MGADDNDTSCTCTKTLVMLFNTLFWIISCGIIVLALLLVFDDGAKSLALAVTSNKQQYLDVVTYVLLALGIFQFLMSYAGCYGSMRERKGALGVFILSVFLVISAEVAAAVVVIVFQSDILAGIQPGLMATVSNYSSSETTAVFWNTIQSQFTCCGADNSTNYPSAPFEYPCTCYNATCNLLEAQFLPNTANVTLHEQACYGALVSWFRDNFPTFIGVCCAFGAFELLGFVLAVVLCCQIPTKKVEPQYGSRRSPYQTDYPMSRRYESNYR